MCRGGKPHFRLCSVHRPLLEEFRSHSPPRTCSTLGDLVRSFCEHSPYSFPYFLSGRFIAPQLRELPDFRTGTRDLTDDKTRFYGCDVSSQEV